jgi:YgiT-type zinc finger domain-containing protein
MNRLITDLPFKAGERSIAIVKDIPVIHCRNCVEYLIEDEVMDRVETILSMIDDKAELGIIRYAA